jgi:hypothetical protein
MLRSGRGRAGARNRCNRSGLQEEQAWRQRARCAESDRRAGVTPGTRLAAVVKGTFGMKPAKLVQLSSIAEPRHRRPLDGWRQPVISSESPRCSPACDKSRVQPRNDFVQGRNRHAVPVSLTGKTSGAAWRSSPKVILTTPLEVGPIFSRGTWMTRSPPPD